ncbi:hypothetical protein ACVWZ8_005024 [Arthrobacter sp. UYCu723]
MPLPNSQASPLDCCRGPDSPRVARLWQTSNAVFDYGQLEARKKVGKKLSAGGKAVVFAMMALTFAASAAGNSRNSGQSTSDFTVQS